MSYPQGAKRPRPGPRRLASCSCVQAERRYLPLAEDLVDGPILQSPAVKWEFCEPREFVENCIYGERFTAGDGFVGGIGALVEHGTNGGTIRLNDRAGFRRLRP